MLHTPVFTKKELLHSMYLSWCNDFITVSCFADYYHISEEKANRIIDIGRTIHETEVEKLQG